MVPDKNVTERINKVLEKRETELSQAWLERIHAVIDARVLGRVNQNELRNVMQDLVRRLPKLVRGFGNALPDVSHAWEKTGLSPRETATCLVSLKDALLEFLQKEFGGKRKLLAAAVTCTNRLTDELAVTALDDTRTRREDKLENLLELDEILRADQELPDLCQRIINYLTPCLEAKYGVLHLLHEDYRLKFTCRPGADGKDAPSGFTVSDGVVSQAARDRKPILLTKEQDDESEERTTTNAPSRSSVLLQPVVNAGVTKAVLEFGFAVENPQAQKSLLDGVTEGIRASLSAADARARVPSLLETIRRHEEEIRQLKAELNFPTGSPKDAPGETERRESTSADSLCEETAPRDKALLEA